MDFAWCSVGPRTEGQLENTVEKFFKTVAQDEDWDEDRHPYSAFTFVDPTRLRSCRSLARGNRGSN